VRPHVVSACEYNDQISLSKEAQLMELARYGTSQVTLADVEHKATPGYTSVLPLPVTRTEVDSARD
jgi:hypothetical protein